MNLDELRQKRAEQLEAQAQAEAQIQQLEAIVKAKMTKEAIERYGTLKMAHPQNAVQALIVLAQALQAGSVDTIDDALFKNILTRLTPKKHKSKIIRK